MRNSEEGNGRRETKIKRAREREIERVMHLGILHVEKTDSRADISLGGYNKNDTFNSTTERNI